MRTEHEFKIIILGDQNVGKSSILSRFDLDSYDQYQKATIGSAFLTKTLKLPQQNVNLKVNSLNEIRYGIQLVKRSTGLYRKFIIKVNADAALLVFDMLNKPSLTSVVKWYSQMQDCTETNKLVVLIIANKSDLVDINEFDKQQLDLYAKDLNAEIIYTSAKNGDGIKNLFQDLAQKLVEKELEMKLCSQKNESQKSKKFNLFRTTKSLVSQNKKCC